MAKFGSIKGPAKSSGESVGTSREQGLSPQRSYEPTGSIPKPRMANPGKTRSISGPQGGGNNQAGFTPENQRGPSKGGV